MLVRVLARKVPNVGLRGDVRNIDVLSAKVLILLGKVEKVETAEPIIEPVIEPPKKTKRTYKKPVIELEKKSTYKKRTYKRRDMKAEK